MRTETIPSLKKETTTRPSKRLMLLAVAGALAWCLLSLAATVSAQNVDRLPGIVQQLPTPNGVRQLPGPRFLPGSVSSKPEPKTRQSFPPARLGPDKPIGKRIKVIRIPDLYAQCPTGDVEQLLNLCEAISYSAGNNPMIRQAQAEVRNARAGKKIAFAPFLPSISAQNQLYKSSNPFLNLIYGGAPTSANQELNIAQISAEWIIWDFGRTLGTYRQSDTMFKIARLRCARVCQTIGYNTADAYFQVLIGKASVRVANDSIERSEEYLRVANNMYQAGKIDSEGVLSAQLDLVNSQQLMVNAIARRQVSVAGLNKVLGIKLLDSACVRDVESQPNFFPPIDQCLQTGLIKRPEMCVARNEIAYAIQQCKVAKSGFKPKVTANGNFSNITGSFETDLWEGNVQFEWDLFAGGARVGSMRQAQAMMSRAKAYERQIYDDIVYEINQSYEQLRAARHQLTLSRAAIVVAKEKYRIVLNKFRVGKASPTDVVDAQTELTTAEQDYYTAIYKLHIAIADLNYQMGNIACCPVDEV